MDKEQKVHAELLELYRDACRNIDLAKKNNWLYPTIYSGIAAALYHLSAKELDPRVCFTLLFISACVCVLLIREARARLQEKRRILERIDQEFSAEFIKARGRGNVVNPGLLDNWFPKLSIFYTLVLLVIGFIIANPFNLSSPMEFLLQIIVAAFIMGMFIGSCITGYLVRLSPTTS